MSNLNYHHLLYFWEVARHRSVSRASKEMKVSQPTVSAQLKMLEKLLGGNLFIRTGRDLVLTELGQMTYDYANEIFTLGKELEEAIQTRTSGRGMRLRVGVVDGMPKICAFQLLKPVMDLGDKIRLQVREDRHERLMSELAAHKIDLILSHEPANLSSIFKGSNYALGDSGVSFLASINALKRITGDFPQCLNDLPMYLPANESPLRRALDDWFVQQGVRPRIVAEFVDSALLKQFGQNGTAVFPVLTVVEQQVMQQYRVKLVGRAPEIRERFFAIAASKHVTHAGINAICRQPRLTEDSVVPPQRTTDMGMLREIAKRIRNKREK